MARQYPRVELYYDGAWNNQTRADGTTRVYMRDGIQITCGRGNEQTEPAPSVATLSFSNLDDDHVEDGRYNPRNPESALFGKIGRNTPLRISNGTVAAFTDAFTRSVTNGWGSLDTGQAWTLSGGTNPDDYDVDGSKGTHTHPSANVLHHSYVSTGVADHRVRATVNLSAATITGADASAWLLARMTDTSNYYAALVNLRTTGDVQLGIYKRVAGSLLPVQAVTTVLTGYSGSFNTAQFVVELYVEGDEQRAKVWDATDPEPFEWTVSTTDAGLPTGNLVGVAGRRETGNTNANLRFEWDNFLAIPGTIRFTGEVSSWKPRRELKGDAWTEVTASGVLRRLTQGRAPLRSPAFREVNRQTVAGVIAYWPCEDGSAATELAAGLTTHGPLRIVGGSPSLGSADNFPGSAPVIDMGAASTPVLYGRCPVSADTGSIKLRMFMSFPAAGFSSDQRMVDLYTAPGTGSIRLWRFNYSTLTVGSFQLQGLDSTFTVVEDSGLFLPEADGFDGRTWMLGFEVTENGADVDWEMAAHLLNEDGTETGYAITGTFTGQTVGIPDEIYIGPDAGLVDSSIGHIIVGNDVDTVDGLENAFTGWLGETAAARASRLCDEEAVNFELVGTASDTMGMGPQPIDTFVEILTECERTDDGVLYEQRDGRGLGYRTRTDRYNQDDALELDFTGGEIAPPLDPDIDDFAIRNDIVVKRTDGSSARATQDTGPLNVQDPEDDVNGVGRYESQWDVNTDTDSILTDIAGWRLHLGTVDETRYPRVIANLDAAPGLEPSASRVRVGDVVDIVNLEADTVSQIVSGYTETIGTHRRTIEFNCMPASPYNVVELDSGTLGRLDTEDSELASGINTTATSLSVTTNSGPLWTTDAGEMPFTIRIGGEVMTVTAIAGASSPQTFTVTRSTNGVVKSHAAGAAVNVANPVVLAL